MQHETNTAQSQRKGPMPIMMHLALMALSPNDMKDILQGLHNYHHHDYDRNTELPTLEAHWQSGEVQLLRAAPNAANNKHAPICIIPSFINGSEILDLTKERSLIRWLAQQGHECFLLDWGNLTRDEQGHSFSALVLKRLIPALNHIIDNTKKKPSILGYCLGGNFALALSSLCQEHINKLILLATPWDFQHPDNKLRPLLLDAESKVKKRAANNEAITTEFLQSLFIQTDLQQSAKKYANFGRHDPQSPDAKHFVATEDWVNGGAPIPAKLIKECIDIFYRQNVTMNNNWQIGDSTNIEAHKLKIPTMVVTPEHDHIVPHASSSALTPFLPNAKQLNVDSGHIGMIVGRKAKEICWQPLLSFLSQ